MTPPQVKERPIIFSGPMVRAILNGRKTQTRRVVKPQPIVEPDDRMHWNGIGWTMHHDRLTGPSGTMLTKCPYGRPGDRLWVRESVRITSVADDDGAPLHDPPVWYEADGECPSPDDYRHVRPSIHMPRWASRITLEIASVRVERLQSISGMDARQEGVGIPAHLPQDGADLDHARRAFTTLWDSINGKRPGHTWASNPWVWRVEFKRAKP